MKFVSEYGCEKIRLLEFVRNRGKGGAVRMVSKPVFAVIYHLFFSYRVV